ncbi:MAG TPA: hypothetical protein VJ063_02535, partial [Verrucomicrobiae bacterium]|nr:hypothetical protein [Verrucomicrobiae bacterium]
MMFQRVVRRCNDFGIFVLLCIVVVALNTGAATISLSPPNAVGRVATNRHVTPTGQVLTPAGRQIDLMGMRPQMLALSPDGKLLATAGKSNVLILINPVSGEILQAASLSTNLVEAKAAAEKADEPEDPALRSDVSDTNTTRGSGSRSNAPVPQVSFTGLTFSPDGRRIYLASAGGNIRAFPVDKKNVVGRPVALPVPDIEGGSRRQRREIATGLAVSRDGKRLYVAGNVANKLHELDTQTGGLLRSWDT